MNISTQVSDDTAEKAVKSWIDNVIVGLNFCPFAKKELERDTVRFAIFHSTQANDAHWATYSMNSRYSTIKWISKLPYLFFRQDLIILKNI
jgi:hypothetical protein